MSIERIRLSQQAKDQLIKLKRDTGITQWNVLCRWAFCVSLAEPSMPPDSEIPADSNLELDWKTFGGEQSDVYWVLLLEKCYRDNLRIDAQTLNKYFRLHLHRGIGYLATPSTISSLDDLLHASIRPLKTMPY